ncbi:MAG: methyltransferase domain-containing protein [Chloracidobacterium sp.]|uniref:Methyltransferase domain-containing protein n=1 Tax=Chloracidobacterium validum TaxID=2821543 RepID=A0ABX8B8Z0_9BACT|nr:methyltransferase domain-containing protein [Chloracidobacterium validum]QUW02110.1 methyltransferase domain-containing protein [Chloracidobacterium validum]
MDTRLATLLPRLRCPVCASVSLTLQGDRREGAFACGQCSAHFPVRDGVADFLPNGNPALTFAQLTGQWQLTATVYERLWRTRALSLLSGENFPPEREIGLLLDALEPTFTEDGLWLDAACSTSYYGRPIARQLLERGRDASLVVGIDLSRRMLEEARAYAVREGVAEAMFWLRADMSATPLNDATVLGIACGGSLNEYRDARSVLREGRRVLRPEVGRYFIMNQLDPPLVIRAALSAMGGLTFFTRQLLNDTLETAGLRILSAADYGKLAITVLTA